MHGKHRNVVRKAQKAGVTVEVDGGAGDLAAFAALYEQTMRRQDAGGLLLLPARVLGAADGSAAIGSSASTPRTRASSSLRRSACAATAGSTTTSGRPPTARATSARATSCSTRRRVWGQEQGLEEFHLGGGAGGEEDSLFAFKQRFSPDGRREFWTGKPVHDEAAYRSSPAAPSTTTASSRPIGERLAPRLD